MAQVAPVRPASAAPAPAPASVPRRAANDRPPGSEAEARTALVLLAPFLAVYALFLIYPFAKGVWISLHDWNLMEVAFNPGAKEFVGLRNYERVMWGRGIVWSPWASPIWQLGALAALALAAALRHRRRITGTAALALAIPAAVLFVAWGFHPGEGGRWFDRRFWPTVGNTVTFVALTVPSITAVALVLAAALNRETRAMTALRTAFFLSQVLSVTVVTLIWQIMFSPRQGLVANVATLLGGSPVSWLTDERFAIAAIVIATVWWSLGIAMMLFLAGLQDINREIYEAAELDGASPLHAFRKITVPLLTRTITLVVVLQIILHFQVFGQAHLMTNGGPNDATQVLVRYVYQTAFRDSELGRASAMAVFLFAIMAGFSAIQFLVGRERS